jgi:hypothetical protein
VVALDDECVKRGVQAELGESGRFECERSLRLLEIGAGYRPSAPSLGEVSLRDVRCCLSFIRRLL